MQTKTKMYKIILLTLIKFVNKKCLVKNTPIKGAPDKPNMVENKLNIPQLPYK